MIKCLSIIEAGREPNLIIQTGSVSQVADDVEQPSAKDDGSVASDDSSDDSSVASGDSEINVGWISQQTVQRRDWTDSDICRLRALMKDREVEKIAERKGMTKVAWIAKELRRTESAVVQRWRMLNRQLRRR
jgi:hypothetical protein